MEILKQLQKMLNFNLFWKQNFIDSFTIKLEQYLSVIQIFRNSLNHWLSINNPNFLIMEITIKPFFKILLVIFLLFEGQLYSQITIDEIIAKHLEASGFENAKLDLQKFKIEGVMVQNKAFFPLIIRGVLPYKFRMDLTYNNQAYIKISNGNVSWDYNPAIDSVSSVINQSEESQNFIDRLTGGLYNYKSGLIKAELLGVVSIDDVELYKLEIFINKLVRIYYIDKLSFLIIRIDDDLAENKITYYDDYRKVGNYYLPFSLTGFEGGEAAIAMQFKTMQINPDIKDELFEKPVKHNLIK